GITQISAARRAATARATKNIAKHVAKNIAKASTTGPRTTKAALTTAYAGMAKLVVSSALLRIRKHFIGFFSFFEFLFGFFVIWVSIGVITHGHTAISAADFFVVRSLLNAQYFVIITLRHTINLWFYFYR